MTTHRRSAQVRFATPVCWLLLLAAVVCAGCRSGPRAWPLPKVADPLPASRQGAVVTTFRTASFAAPAGTALHRGSWSEVAERQYAEAVELRRAGAPEAVERFYQATLSSWSAWRQGTQSTGQHAPPAARAWQLYHSSLLLLLRTAQDHGRWDARQGLLIQTAAGLQPIPLVHRGFTWSPQDFHRLELVGEYDSDELNQVDRRAGLGVPLVVLRQSAVEERFYNRVVPFAATAVLRPASDAIAAPNERESLPTGTVVVLEDQVGVLELLDPRHVHDVAVAGGGRWPLAADLSAPWAWAVSQNPSRAWSGFLRPDTEDGQTKLFMLEPHQPGKVPLVFIHGLLSDSLTWVPLANDLASEPWFREHYEIWGFRYPTGNPFTHSAAALRAELTELKRQIDTAAPDPAVSRMVLVGHSMGGLLAKLQVTSSGDHLWRSVAHVPFQSIRARPETRQTLARGFFFEPRPFIERVVFIGTPHEGSSLANRLIGRVGSFSVRPQSELQRQHRVLVEDNPDAIADFARRRVPTSIDMLEPQNPLLLAIRRLPVSPGVRLNSVIGVRHPGGFSEPSDGVVPVSSARHDGVENELLIDARHMDLHKDPRTSAFLLETLMQ